MKREGVIVNCLKTRIFKRPTDYSDVSYLVNMLTRVIIEDKEKDYFRIKTEDGKEGYIHKNYIALCESD